MGRFPLHSVELSVPAYTCTQRSLRNPDALCGTLFNSGKGDTLLMNRTKSVIALLGIAGLASFAPAANAITILDVFNGPQSASLAPGPASTNFADSPLNILGGNRVLTVGQTAGLGNISSNINAGTLNFNSDFATDGFLTLGYSTPSFDITPGANGLTGQLAGDLGGANFTLTINSTGGGTSSASQLIIPSGAAGTFSGFSIPFASLVGNVNLMQVTGVTLRLDGTNSFDGALRLLQFSTPPGDVPEPGAVALLIGGALSGAVVLRRRRK